jgi:hypothetical protein
LTYNASGDFHTRVIFTQPIRRHFIISIAALCFAFCLSAPAFAQDYSPLTFDITEALNATAPDRQMVATVESSHIPLVPSEKPILTAVWQDRHLPADLVSVSVYGVANTKEATDWLKPIRLRRVSPGWKVRSYHFGDESYLLEHTDPLQFEIQFRSGNAVAKVSARDIKVAEEFAQCIARELATMSIATPEIPPPGPNGLQMSIGPTQPPAAGQQLTQLTVTFNNMTRHELSFAPGTTIRCGGSVSKTSQVRLNLTGPRGKVHHHMPYLGDGPPYLAACAGRIDAFVVLLHAHESIALPLDLSKYFDFADSKQYDGARLPAGVYSVEAEFAGIADLKGHPEKITWAGTLKSNPLPIQFNSEFASPLDDYPK